MLTRAVNRAFVAVAFGYGFFHLYTAAMGPFPPIAQRSIHIGVAVAMGFALCPFIRGRERGKVAWWEIVAMAVAFASVVYFVSNSTRIIQNPSQAMGWDMYVSIAFLIILLEATRRAMGIVIPLLVIGFLLYALLGAQVPGMFRYRGMSPTLVQELLFLTDDGIWGAIPRVTSTVVAIFIIFGALMLRCGLGRVFVDLVLLVGGRAVGGAAKVAVLASALFGMISGSAVANIALTGSVTIPMMKRLGYKPEFAAATELSASTGGQFMPPIMGAGAFLIAEFTGTPYARIALIAFPVALLYFLSVWLSIHFYSLRVGLRGLPRDQIPRAREVLTLGRVARLTVPIGLLMGLLFSGFTPTFAGFMATAAVAILHLFVDFKPGGMRTRFVEILGAIADAGRTLMVLGLLAGSAQVIVSLTTMTPFAVLFAGQIMSLTGGTVILTLVLTMVLCLILGMGVPTTAAYVLGITMAFPVMNALGIERVTAHLFVFYFAILSVVTPPVAAGVFVAAPMAGADMMKTAVMGLRLASVGFILPFLFVYRPAILLSGTVAETGAVVVSVVLALICFAAALMRHFRVENRIYETVLLVVAGALFISPGLLLNFLGLVPLILVYWLQRPGSRLAMAPVPDRQEQEN